MNHSSFHRLSNTGDRATSYLAFPASIQRYRRWNNRFVYSGSTEMQNTVFKWWFDPFLIGCEVANVTFISLGVEVDLYSHSSSGNDSYERGLFKIWEIVAPESSVLHLNVIRLWGNWNFDSLFGQFIQCRCLINLWKKVAFILQIQ